VVVSDVPPNCTVVGIPGHIVMRGGERVDEERKDAAQHKECLPDPMEEELQRIKSDLVRLQECLDKRDGRA